MFEHDDGYKIHIHTVNTQIHIKGKLFLLLYKHTISKSLQTVLNINYFIFPNTLLSLLMFLFILFSTLGYKEVLQSESLLE